MSKKKKNIRRKKSNNLLKGVAAAGAVVGGGTIFAGNNAVYAALGILIPYYIGLYLLRNKLRNKLSFSLEPCS